MTPAAIPCRVLAGTLAAVMDWRARQADNRADAPPRQSPDAARARAHAEGRRKTAALCRTQRGRLFALVRHGRGTVDAATAGLLCALAYGCTDLARGLEDHLAALGHPAADAVCDLPAEDVAGILEAILSRQHRP